MRRLFFLYPKQSHLRVQTSSGHLILLVLGQVELAGCTNYRSLGRSGLGLCRSWRRFRGRSR